MARIFLRAVVPEGVTVRDTSLEIALNGPQMLINGAQMAPDCDLTGYQSGCTQLPIFKKKKFKKISLEKLKQQINGDQPRSNADQRRSNVAQINQSGNHSRCTQLTLNSAQVTVKRGKITIKYGWTPL